MPGPFPGGPWPAPAELECTEGWWVLPWAPDEQAHTDSWPHVEDAHGCGAEPHAHLT